MVAILLDLIGNASLGITAQNDPKRWIFQLRKVPESTGTFDWVSRLPAIHFFRQSSNIDMIVSWLLNFTKRHAVSRPFCAERTRFDAGQVNVPLGLHLLAQTLCKTLDSKLARAVEAERRHPALPTYGRDLKYASTDRLIGGSESPDGCPGDVHDPEKVDFHLSAPLLV